MKEFKDSEKKIAKLLQKAGEGILLTSEEKSLLKAKITDSLPDSVTNSYPEQYKRQAYRLNFKGVTMPFLPVIIAILLAGGVGTAALADSSIPGQTLYGLDQAMERFQERVTTNTQAKARLWAKLSEERAEELIALNQEDPAQMADHAREMWEHHQEEALERLGKSIERVETLKAKFEEKLGESDNEDRSAAYQRVIDHLGDKIEALNQRIDSVEAGELPGVGNLPIRQRLQAWIRTSPEVREQIHEMVEEEFGDDMPGFGPMMGRHDRDDDESDDDRDSEEDDDRDNEEDEDDSDDSSARGQTRAGISADLDASIQAAIAYFPQPPIEIVDDEVREIWEELRRKRFELSAEERAELRAQIALALDEMGKLPSIWSQLPIPVPLNS